MKELSVEQKAKAYDEAIKKAKSLYKASEPMSGCNVIIEILFPELKESDERIRKWLIYYFKEVCDNVSEKEKKGVLAWLEKQGKKEPITCPICGWEIEKQAEQKPKVEPKFKVGDWVTNGIDFTFQIHSIENNMYLRSDDYFIDIETADKKFRLWTIQDAKDGDVIYLPNGNDEYYFFIFKGIENAAVMSFAHFYQYNDGTSEVKETIDNLSSVDDVFQPATKEQCAFLFQKMKEASYEWDAEHRQLKKIEKKPANEPIFNVGDKIQYSKGCGIILTIEKIENGEYIFCNNMGHTTIEYGNKWYLVDG